MDFLLLPNNTAVPNSASTPLANMSSRVCDPVAGNSPTATGVVVVDLGFVVVVDADEAGVMHASFTMVLLSSDTAPLRARSYP